MIIMHTMHINERAAASNLGGNKAVAPARCSNCNKACEFARVRKDAL
jgi:hypothetical protein